MRFIKWQLTAVICGVAILAVPAFPAESREEVLKKREALLKEMEKEALKKLNVSRGDGMFLKILVESSKSRRALELGSLYGYSAIWIGSGLEQTGGRLRTIEIDPDRAQRCRENVKEAGLEKVVTTLEADALEVIPKLEGEFDFVFIDAWKPDYHKYFKLIYPRVKEGGLIVAHNAIRRAEEMPEYLDIVTKHPGLDTIFVMTTPDPKKPAEDGFCISVKKKAE